MSANLLDLFTSGIGKDFGPLAAQVLGESSGATQSAMGSILPTLLGGLMKSGGSASGASSLLSMLNGPQVNSGLLDNIAGLFGGGQAQNPLMAAGGPLLSMLFGDKVGGIANALSSVAGIKSGSASSLLTMAAPLVFGLLKKYVGSNNLNAGGLQSLLAGQAKHLGGGKLNDSILGAAGLGSAASFLGGFGDIAKNLGGAAMGAATGAAGAAAAGTTAAAAAGKSALSRFLPWIIAAAVALFLLSQCKTGTQKSAEAPKPAPAPAASAPATPAPAPAPVAAAPAPAPAPAATPAAEVEKAPEQLKGANYPELVSLFFDSGKTNLPADADKQLAKLVEWAKSGPNTKVGLSGYHDTSGDAKVNAELAKNRARAAREALVKAGVPEDRMIMVRPQVAAAGGADDKASRRVDVYPAQ